MASVQFFLKKSFHPTVPVYILYSMQYLISGSSWQSCCTVNRLSLCYSWYTIEYLEWPCTVNSRLASWTIPDLFLSREKYRCRAEIDHFANQLLNLQGFISVVYVWGVSHCLKCNIYSQFSLLSMNLLVCSSPRYNMGKYYFLGFLV